MEGNKDIGCKSLDCPGRDELETYRTFVADGKLRINEAFYSLVPAGMTMGEFECLTCDIFERIRDSWEAQFSSSGN